jgi:parallel beta-helix repeat protein
MIKNIFALGALCLAATAAAITLDQNPEYDYGKASGGPDAWGYRYIDSDAPDTAGYSWRDTTEGVWNAVNGLGDDNCIGPFPIGFSFPYYWYTVDQFWIQSNGGISFSIPSRAWTPQNTGESGFPNLALPQDLIGAYGFDLDFTTGGRCRYRSRNTPPESLIVSWLGVRQWNSTRTFTFQIILARADSSIRFQYQASPAWQTGASIGIENMTGGVGLEYYENGTPAGNLPHNGLAVKIYPPAASAYTSTDAGVVAVMNPSSGAVVVHTNDQLRPRATLKNFGTTPITVTRAVCRISNSAGTVVYADTINNLLLNKAQQLDTSFVRAFNPTADGTYRMVVRTEATENPANSSNDSMIVEIPVVTYPSWVAYDDGVRDRWMAWSGTSTAAPTGLGSRFSMTRYPFLLDSILVFVSHQNNNYIWVELYDTTGLGGGPGNLIATDTIRLTPASPGGRWVGVEYIGRNITISDGQFLVGVKTPSANVRFGIDQTAPITRRCWEYTSGWTPYRNMETQDLMLRVKCRPRPQTMAFYVDSTSGSDAYPGTFAQPFRTITHALNVIQGTDTCYVRNGTYYGPLNLIPRHGGISSRYTVLRSQPGHSPRVLASGAYALSDSAASFVAIKGFTLYPGNQQMNVVLQSARACSLNSNTIYVPTMGPGVLAMEMRSSAIRANRVLPVGDNPYPAQGLWLYYSDSIRVDSNIVSGLADVGILLEGTDRCAVYHNVVDHCLMGIDASYSGNDSIYNNTIDASLDIGLHIQGLWGNLAVCNTNLTNGRYGFGWVDGTGSVSSDYNNLWGNTVSNYSYISGYSVIQGGHDISADPLYVAGYVLSPGSPCIDAGTPVGLPASGAPDIGAYEFGLKDPTGIFGLPSGGADFGLMSGRPNPFRDRVLIEYWCPAADDAGASLRIYNISGQLVRVLVEDNQAPGRHMALWDGRDEFGRRAAAGIYYCRLEVGGRRAVKALMLLR